MLGRRTPTAGWGVGVLAAVALLAAGCGQGERAAESDTTAARPQLTAVQQEPLTVKGTGFQPGEQVRLAAKGLQNASASATADSSGEFKASFHGLRSCDSVTVSAVGSKGSRAEFNLSQIACTGT